MTMPSILHRAAFVASLLALLIASSSAGCSRPRAASAGASAARPAAGDAPAPQGGGGAAHRTIPPVRPTAPP